MTLSKDRWENRIRREQRIDETSSKTDLTNKIDRESQNLKSQLMNFKQLILTIPERFHTCQVEKDALDILLQAIDDIPFDAHQFAREDQDRIDVLNLQQDLASKSNKAELIQLKTYIDGQVKKLIELNKSNAKALEQLKTIKTATCEARHLQGILSKQTDGFPSQQQHRTLSHQSSRPYLTFELDHIRKYQRQALLQSPHGTIPLYRRQAWVEKDSTNSLSLSIIVFLSSAKAAANLFPDRPLHYIRYMQTALRMQVNRGCP